MFQWYGFPSGNRSKVLDSGEAPRVRFRAQKGIILEKDHPEPSKEVVKGAESARMQGLIPAVDTSISFGCSLVSAQKL